MLVTGLSAIPHGTIILNDSRSGVTFSAKPCEVMPRRDVNANRGNLTLAGFFRIRPTPVQSR